MSERSEHRYPQPTTRGDPLTAQRPDIQELYDALGVVINRWREVFPEELIFVAKTLANRAMLQTWHEQTYGTSLREDVPVDVSEPFPQ